jgi:NADH pyrophosphatase NudC (nudix superfamily)
MSNIKTEKQLLNTNTAGAVALAENEEASVVELSLEELEGVIGGEPPSGSGVCAHCHEFRFTLDDHRWCATCRDQRRRRNETLGRVANAAATGYAFGMALAGNPGPLVMRLACTVAQLQQEVIH